MCGPETSPWSAETSLPTLIKGHADDEDAIPSRMIQPSWLPGMNKCPSFLPCCLMLSVPIFQGAELAHNYFVTLPKILHTLKKPVQGPCTPCWQGGRTHYNLVGILVRCSSNNNAIADLVSENPKFNFKFSDANISMALLLLRQL